MNASCEAAIDKAECASSDLRADLDRWLVDKDEGIRELVRDMADEHMQYHEKVTMLLLLLLVSWGGVRGWLMAWEEDGGALWY